MARAPLASSTEARSDCQAQPTQPRRFARSLHRPGNRDAFSRAPSEQKWFGPAAARFKADATDRLAPRKINDPNEKSPALAGLEEVPTAIIVGGMT